MTTHRRPASRNDFEIALLCAVNVEVSAVESLFDEDWEREQSYGKAGGDPNSYKTGRISSCNVVLAYLPAMGINSAAKTAIWLKTSFPNISLALLVGICGGVPSSGPAGNDILFGDVVISTGIVHYGLGRLYPNVFSANDEKETNISGPPSQIRSFLAKLQASGTRRTLQENTYKFLLDISRVQSVAYPGASADKLYAASYRHKHQRSADCDTCAACTSEQDAVCAAALKASCGELGCSRDQLVRRRERVQKAKIHERRPRKPRIHFGKIASGNFVMKSGVHRDAIAATEGVIAFEMEGAAVWEELPTIVIKSVCDYADSHKSKDWQTYAASTAAAASKAVLNQCRESNDGRTASRPAAVQEYYNPEYNGAEPKLVWRDGQLVLNFGNLHLNETLQHVAETDRGYLVWMTDPQRGFPADVLRVVRGALNGVFPSPPPQSQSSQ